MRITHEDSFDAQPLSEPGLLFAADVRLDNREAVAVELGIETPVLATMPDSALLFAAWKEWGEACVDHVVGDFAFAAWDARTRALTLVRDHMGQRHVFFHRGKKFFAFATEVTGLWALPDVPRAMSRLGLAGRVLMDSDPGQKKDLFDGISGIPGGTIMKIGADGSFSSRRYWRPQADPAHLGKDEAYYVEAYRRVLGEAVACRVRRTVKPPGMFFGGGFDSTAIAGLAGPHLVPRGMKLVCAAAVMPEGYKGPIRHARKWVELVRKKLPWLDVRYCTREGIDVLTGGANAFLREGMPHSANRYVNDQLYQAVADGGARVVMDGHGGDYTLNPRASRMIPEYLRRGKLASFAREFVAYCRQPGNSMLQGLRLVAFDLFPRLRGVRRGLMHGFEPDYAAETLNPEFLAEARRAGFRTPHERLRRPHKSPREMMRQTIERLSGDYAFGGAIPAARYGLEFTQPYHDKRVVELALAIPEELYFVNGRERHLAKLALSDIYPEEFYVRSTYNDDRTPDFLAMIRRSEPKLLAEIDRMEKSEYLSSIFDFAKVRKFLTQRPVEKQQEGREQETIHAVQKILWARYVEWFTGANR